MACIITGCRAILGGGEVGGDLHLVGDCFVFNAIVDQRGEPAMDYTGDLFRHYRKAINFSPDPSCYEKRGVIVARARLCVLNDEALRHLQQYEPDRNWNRLQDSHGPR